MTNDKPPSSYRGICLMQAPADKPGTVHVCHLNAGHPYIPEADTDRWLHHCECGTPFRHHHP